MTSGTEKRGERKNGSRREKEEVATRGKKK